MVGEEELIKHVTEFYKKLFGPSIVTDLKIDGIECDQLSEEDRDFMTRPFEMEELKEVVFGMKHNKAAGPDGFPAEFWEEVKDVLKENVGCFS